MGVYAEVKGEMNMRDTLKRLKKITDGCRDDMHEPDEQDLVAVCIGDHLDNAMGDSITYSNPVDPKGYKGAFQEFVILLRRNGEDEFFNLATLIALARKAKLS